MLLQKRNIKIVIAAVSLFCIFCLVHFALSAPLVYGDAFSAADTMALSVRTGNTFRQISLWTAEDGRGYFFLPAYAEPEKCCFLYEDNLKLAINGRSVSSGQYLDDISLEEPYTITLTSDEAETVFDEVVFLQSENLPAVYIDTESGDLEYIHEDKANREAADMEIVDASGNIVYMDSLAYIKGHGNSTWAADKKPYYIKLNESESLLGMRSGNKWILFANAGDASLLRNWTAYHLAEEAGIDYTSETRFIDLYINDEYLGNYQLVEKIDIGTERVNIRNLEKANNESNEAGYQENNPRFGTNDEGVKGIDGMTNPEDITGGYLLERNYGSRYRNRASGFITEGNESFVVRSPAYASREEMAYIYNFIQTVENSILAEDGIDAETGLYYADLIDVQSFVKKYLLEEIVLNEAQGATSSWFYKPENTRSTKLYAGPPWDYDKSMANHEIYMSPHILTKLSCYVYNGLTPKWFGALCRKEEFWDAVREDYQECFLPALESLLDGELSECALQIRRSAYMNNIRWQTGNECQDFMLEAERLESWLEQRIDFLNEVWLEGREYCLIWCLKEDGDTTCYIDSVQKGDILTELPTILSDDGRLPLYWYDAEKDIICEPGYEVTQDLKLVPVYGDG